MIRPCEPGESDALVALAESTGLFRPGEAEGLLRGVLDGYHAGRLGGGHRVEAWSEAPGSPPLGWTYAAPTATADGVWDLWWIGVAPGRQGRGIGTDLLRSVEDHARAAGGRVLVVETSSTPALEPTRAFYARRGYAGTGRVPDFYADGDDKVIFAKRIAAAAVWEP